VKFNGSRRGRYVARRRRSALPLLLLFVLLGGTAYLAYSLFAGPPRPGEGEKKVSAPAEAKEVVASLPEGVAEGSRWVRIDKSAYRLDYLDGREIVASFPVALGLVSGDKVKRGDCRTPEGLFEIEQVQDSSWWTHDFGDGKGPIEGAYGPWFIRLKTGWQGIGIHGTHDPTSMGTSVTEGCIRLLNENVQWLKERVELGMKVLIEP
jgi:hypothetical protein